MSYVRVSIVHLLLRAIWIYRPFRIFGRNVHAHVVGDDTGCVIITADSDGECDASVQN